jgi:hypothetical protein
MSKPNPDTVNTLIDATLVTLASAAPGCSASEVVSAVFTIADRLLKISLDMPGVNVEPFRVVLADMYALLPKETVN